MESDSSDNSSAAAEPEMSLEGREAAHKAEVDAAFSTLMSAWATYLNSLQRHHHFVGWKQGFGDGWDGYMQYIREQANSQMASQMGMLGSMTFSSPTLLQTAESTPISPPDLQPTASDLVAQFIHEYPGWRGVEIAIHFKSSIWALPERTVRTAFHRLKKAGKIKVVDGRWYSADAAPADPQLKLKEEDDMPPP